MASQAYDGFVNETQKPPFRITDAIRPEPLLPVGFPSIQVPRGRRKRINRHDVNVGETTRASSVPNVGQKRESRRFNLYQPVIRDRHLVVAHMDKIAISPMPYLHLYLESS